MLRGPLFKEEQMTPRENYLAFFRDEPYEWIPMAGDVRTFRPEELHDNVARGFVNQQEPFPPEKFGGKVTWDELGLPVTDTGMCLPCGATGRWIAV